MKIELISVDLDGTLLDRDGVTVPEVNIHALRAAAERGARIVLASGRPLDMLDDAIRQLGRVDYAISSNGAVLTDLMAGRRLLERCIPPEILANILELLRPYHIIREVHCDDHIYVGRADMAQYQVISPYDGLRGRYDILVDDLEKAVAGWGAEKVNLDHIPLSQVYEVVNLLRRDRRLVVTPTSTPDNLEIGTAEADKGLALQYLCQLLGIGPGAVMAFGDSGNDIGMLSWAGLSFAMENASPAAKRAAGRIAPVHTDGGVGLVVEEYLAKIG